jgi:FAD/FMN-containing dehydrogenase
VNELAAISFSRHSNPEYHAALSTGPGTKHSPSQNASHMNRRNLLRHLAAIPVLLDLWPNLANAAPAAIPSAKLPTRRVRPSDANWPTPASWENLRRQVGGHLLQVPSPLAACQSAFNEAACQTALKNLRNPFYIGDQPGASQTTGWVNAWNSTPSAYAVAARNSADVAAAVNFARENNLRLVVKGGGHSYQGTSSSSDSLLIWTRAMKQIAVHDAFVPQGCDAQQSPQPAATIEAGAMWIDAYSAVTTQAGRYVQGGGCATVGVAGLIQSGGFGSFSKNYGMAAAGLLQAEIVTADGTVRIANSCMHPDLFWAIKGGGGGSFGVVTKVTLLTRELPEYFGRVHATIKASSDETFRKLIARFISFYKASLFSPNWGESIAIRKDNALAISMAFQALNQQQAQDLWQPFFAWVAQSPRDFTVTPAPTFQALPARHYWDATYREKNSPASVSIDDRPGALATHVWWSSNQEEVGIYVHGYDSAWLPDSLLESDQLSKLADTLFSSSRLWDVGLHFNKGLAGAPAEAVAAASDTAMNPAVLKSFALAIIAGGRTLVYPGVPGHEPDLALARQQAAAIAQSMDELRKIAPGPGAYVSESNFFDPSWQQSFWGANYARLQTVKAKYDPEGLFFVHHGVGSEKWSADGFAPLVS